MKKIPVLLLILLIIVILVVIFFTFSLKDGSFTKSDKKLQLTQQPIISSSAREKQTERITVIAENMDTPWAIAFLPVSADSSEAIELLVTERKGTVKHVKMNGQIKQVAYIAKAQEIGEGGLMGIALHPEFSSNNFLYLYYTYGESGSDTLNRVVRMTYKNDSLIDEKIIVDQIPGAPNHNGGRIKFGPDNFLYIATGDAERPSLAQNKNSLAGKILRVTDTGAEAQGNPFGTKVYSYGHRNPQGFAWLAEDRFYATEHGPSGGQFGTGRDELNLISPGNNYGWPEIIGDQIKNGMERPLLHSNTDTWAPSGAAFYKHSDLRDAVFFGGLRGEALYEVNFTGDKPILLTHFKNEFGRIREVIIGPDNMLYITTSNNDGRGIANPGDDKIIRINPEKL